MLLILLCIHKNAYLYSPTHKYIHTFTQAESLTNTLQNFLPGVNHLILHLLALALPDPGQQLLALAVAVAVRLNAPEGMAQQEVTEGIS